MKNHDQPWIAHYPLSAQQWEQPAARPMASVFLDAAERAPANPCLTYADQTWSYGQVSGLVNRLSRGLQDLGVERGDRIAICMPNHPAFVIAYYAALQIGAVVLSQNPLYPVAGLARQLEAAGVRIALIVDLPEVQAKAGMLLSQGTIKNLVVCRMDAGDLSPPPAAGLTASDDPNVIDLAALIANDGRFAPVDIDTHDLAALQPTGGTTGVPKCAMLTHANFYINLHQILALMPSLEFGKETFLVPLPLFHITGTMLLMHIGISLGARLILMPSFDIDKAIDLSVRHGVTYMAFVPTIYTALLSNPRAPLVQWSKIKIALAGGAPVPVELRRRFFQTFGVSVRQAYGLSECCPGVSMMPDTAGGSERSIGIPIPATQVEIRDLLDPSIVLAPGERGEICVKGPQVMQGYWNQPDESGQYIMSDGFLRTGDIGTMDAQGFFEVLDRLKDMIIASGFKIYPSAIEAVIYQYDGVAETVVIGVPDPYRGETTKAFVSARPGCVIDLDALRRFLSSRLAPYEVPKLYEIRDHLPKTPAGKLSRLALRQEESEKSSHGEAARATPS